eukprot:TRINITY_DN13000_c0_g2_i11.p1 TRINITY_DN13000_c0_g2~~TRINITY_DN13000_c0_g2_i11.p1  ORF type:complete len:186 (+),score=53.18 TRINITY_DN13000_c0_g2_i11:114-671(+)
MGSSGINAEYMGSSGINAEYMGVEQSRRDDLESAVYVLVYFLKGSLPWQGLSVKGKAEKYRQIKELKANTAIEEICKDLPLEIQSLLGYTRGLKFEEKPDYDYMKRLLKDIATENKFEINNSFDWTIAVSKDEGWVDVKEEAKATKEVNESTVNYLVPSSSGNQQKQVEDVEQGKSKRGMRCNIV